MIAEPESPALARHVGGGAVLATSRIAIVEVARATSLANPAAAVQRDTERLLASCALVDVTDPLLHSARRLTSDSIRTLDAIHLASALRVDPDEVVAYERRLLNAAAQRGLAVASPGAE